MIFELEQEMVAPAVHWLEARDWNMRVRHEFATPWGICDLVGVSLNEHKVQKRLANGQRQPLGPLARVAVYSSLSDWRPTPLTALCEKFGSVLGETEFKQSIERLVDNGYAKFNRRGDALTRINGWLPLHKKAIAIELKLSRVADALYQASANREFVDESYVGLPIDVAERVARSSIYAEFRATGVGILGVSLDECRRILRPSLPPKPNSVAQLHCIERFWRSRLKDN